MQSSEMRALIFRKSTSRRSFQLGLRWAKMGLAYLENGRVVMIPYLCFRASFSVRSFRRFMGTGKFCVYTGLSYLGVKHTLNCVFIPMSRRWRAKMALNLSVIGSRFSRSSPVIGESFHSNIERNCVLERSLV